MNWNVRKRKLFKIQVCFWSRLNISFKIFIVRNTEQIICPCLLKWKTTIEWLPKCSCESASITILNLLLTTERRPRPFHIRGVVPTSKLLESIVCSLILKQKQIRYIEQFSSITYDYEFIRWNCTKYLFSPMNSLTNYISKAFKAKNLFLIKNQNQIKNMLLFRSP